MTPACGPCGSRPMLPIVARVRLPDGTVRDDGPAWLCEGCRAWVPDTPRLEVDHPARRP